MSTDSYSASTSNQIAGGRKAWVTLLTQPSYLAGVLTLHRTLASVSSFPLIVMATPALSAASRTPLIQAGIEIIDVSPLSPTTHTGFEGSFARFQDIWTKLAVFGLEGFERVVMIDSDMIFLQGMDELFDLQLPGRDWIGAVPACVCNPLKIAHYSKDWIPANCQYAVQSSLPRPLTLSSIPAPNSSPLSHLLNSGLVLLHPSPSLMSELTTYLADSPDVAEAKFADQDVITAVFRGRWQVLPYWANALKTLRAVHGGLWRDDEVRLIHYILDKPWSHRPAYLPPYQPPAPATSALNGSRRPLPAGLLEAVRSSPPQKDARTYDEVDAWWWIVYEEVLHGMKARGEAWEEMDSFVKR